MTRNILLKTKLPVIPYLVWNSRNSNSYHETICGDYGKKRVVLLWTTFKPEQGKKADGKITIFYNDISKPEREWYHKIATCENKEQYIKELFQLAKSLI